MQYKDVAGNVYYDEYRDEELQVIAEIKGEFVAAYLGDSLDDGTRYTPEQLESLIESGQLSLVD